jgi:hypothetical protein
VHPADEHRGNGSASRTLSTESMEALEQYRRCLVGVLEHGVADADHQLALGDVNVGGKLGELKGAGEVVAREPGVEFGPRRSAEKRRHAPILPGSSRIRVSVPDWVEPRMLGRRDDG